MAPAEEPWTRWRMLLPQGGGTMRNPHSVHSSEPYGKARGDDWGNNVWNRSDWEEGQLLHKERSGAIGGLRLRENN